MEKTWTTKAELYALMSISLNYPTMELAEALVDGSYAEDLSELIQLNQLKKIPDVLTSLASYTKETPQKVLNDLRIEHTRLFLAGEDTPISLFGESWAAKEKNIQPLLFIGEEARAVEKFMASCGFGHAEDRHEPLDHLATELDFLRVLCLVRSGSFELPKDIQVPKKAYEEFYQRHFLGLARKVGTSLEDATGVPMFSIIAALLKEMPDQSL